MRSIKMFKQLQKGWLRQMVTSGWPYGKGKLELFGCKMRAIGIPVTIIHTQRGDSRMRQPRKILDEEQFGQW